MGLSVCLVAAALRGKGGGKIETKTTYRKRNSTKREDFTFPAFFESGVTSYATSYITPILSRNIATKYSLFSKTAFGLLGFFFFADLEIQTLPPLPFSSQTSIFFRRVLSSTQPPRELDVKGKRKEWLFLESRTADSRK